MTLYRGYDGECFEGQKASYVQYNLYEYEFRNSG